jgi:hypothetical protein
MNPMPALIILLLGKMMSSHHQASMLSTMIHSQWGSMFMGFALARCLTYIIMYVAPPTSYLPSRPPTEIITSFCLVAGGITFIVSNKDTVAALESYGLDAMFMFTVTMGLTARSCWLGRQWSLLSRAGLFAWRVEASTQRAALACWLRFRASTSHHHVCISFSLTTLRLLMIPLHYTPHLESATAWSAAFTFVVSRMGAGNGNDEYDDRPMI